MGHTHRGTGADTRGAFAHGRLRGVLAQWRRACEWRRLVRRHRSIVEYPHRGGESNPREERGVDSIAFSPDGFKLASASGSSVRLWDAGTGEHLRTLVHSVGRFAFSPDGKTLAIGSAGAIEIWESIPARS